ncbi:MAG: hypothetical protein LBU88_10975 [Treponema sp.]|jgi:hypothetical protein|nr:hypothetical protein [Treponema sp.]
MKIAIKIFSVLGLCLIISCAKNPNNVDFGNYPADYEIAYFETLGIKNIPSVRDLYGRHVQYANKAFEMPSYVTIESFNGSKEDFSVNMLLTVINEETNAKTPFMRFNVKFEADNNTQKSYIRYVKAESLLSGQFLEINSDGSEEQDINAFDLFIRYMERFWK